MTARTDASLTRQTTATRAPAQTPGDDDARGRGWWPGLPGPEVLDDPELGCLELPALHRPQPERHDGLRLRLVHSGDDFAQVLALRREAYRRHGYPELPMQPDAHDRAASTAVIGVFGDDDALLATMRVCTSIHGPIEWSHGLQLPAGYSARRIAFFERLAVARADRRVGAAKQLLFKSAWLLALSARIDVIVVATISPLDRLFATIGFRNVYGPGQTRRVPWHPAEFNVMQMELDSLARMCLRANPAWYFHCTTPDAAIEGLIRAFRRQAGEPAGTAPAGRPEADRAGWQPVESARRPAADGVGDALATHAAGAGRVPMAARPIPEPDRPRAGPIGWPAV